MRYAESHLWHGLYRVLLVTLNRKPPSRSKRPTYNYPSSGSSGNGGGGLPAWLIFILGVALVFGVYYLWLGLRDFMETRGDILQASTEQAVVINTATAERVQTAQVALTPRPSATDLPECQEFIVIAQPSAILRDGPSTSYDIVDTFEAGETLCVIQREGETDWFLIDQNPLTRRVESAYVREDLVEAVNPTPTPSRTFTPAPTVTPEPTLTPSRTFTPAPTDTPNPDATDTPTPTPSATPTLAIQSA